MKEKEKKERKRKKKRNIPSSNFSWKKIFADAAATSKHTNKIPLLMNANSLTRKKT